MLRRIEYISGLVSPDRFFSATIFGRRFHIQGVLDWGPWDSSRLKYFTESYIDPGLVGAAGDRKVRTKGELEAAIKEPMKVAPTRNVWIHESLVDEVPRVSERDRPSESSSPLTS
jgi:hypothetical protein